MKFAEFIEKKSIRTEIKATDKEGVIREMLQSLLAAGSIKAEDFENIVKAVLRREELGSTGIGRGIAVPHSKHQNIEKIVGTVAISQSGIDFDSLDRDKVYLFFLLLSPPDKPREHLLALEHITKQFKDEAFSKFLRQSKTTADIWQLLEEADDNVYGK